MGKEEDNQTPLSEKFTLECFKTSDVKISHKYTLGDLSTKTYCIRYDPNDKYLAAGCEDGTIKIFNVFTGK